MKATNSRLTPLEPQANPAAAVIAGAAVMAFGVALFIVLALSGS